MVAFLATGLFGGLSVGPKSRRATAGRRLCWRFHSGRRQGFKTLSRRLVPIVENLKAWLQPIAKTSGPIVGPNLRKRHEAARERAAIKEWPDNCMRHSFVSFRLAQTQNAPQVALESGHDQAVLFRSYREVVRPKEAERYFSIRPASEAEKIVAIGAA